MAVCCASDFWVSYPVSNFESVMSPVKNLASMPAVGCAITTLLFAFSVNATESVTYNRDVRPILSDKCFHCHGPDKKTRKGKFRLDVREDAVAKGAIVPGKPKESELINRIFAT